MSLVKIAAAKWREAAKRIVNYGAKTKNDKRLVDLLAMGKNNAPSSFNVNQIKDMQNRLSNAAYDAKKKTPNLAMKQMHEEAQIHHRQNIINMSIKEHKNTGAFKIDDRLRNSRGYFSLKNKLGIIHNQLPISVKV